MPDRRPKRTPNHEELRGVDHKTFGFTGSDLHPSTTAVGKYPLHGNHLNLTGFLERVEPVLPQLEEHRHEAVQSTQHDEQHDKNRDVAQ